MMGCHALGEEIDDDGKFLAAAQKDAALVADLLLSLSRCCVPRSRLTEPNSSPSSPSLDAEGAAADPPHPPRWGTRRKRSRFAATAVSFAEKEEETRRSSPTTPLSWSGSSWTSGSIGEPTPSRPPNRRRRRRRPQDQSEGAAQHDAEQGLPPPAKGPPKAEPYDAFRVLGGAEPAAVGSLSGSGSNKAAAVRAPPTRAGAHVAPPGLRSTGEGTNPVGVRRSAKKKTLPELKALTGFLLQEQVELRKELEEQMNLYAALLEENFKLKNMKQSNLEAPVAGDPTAMSATRGTRESGSAQQLEAAEGENEEIADRPDQILFTSLPTSAAAAPSQRAPLPFDLNCPPDDDLLC